MVNGRKRWGLLIAPLAAVGFGLGGPDAAAQGPDQVKLFVCKYVITPGGGERLQTLISVSFNAADAPAVGAFFNDAQGRSFVLALDVGQAKPDISACPPPDDGEETTTSQGETSTSEGQSTTSEAETTTSVGGTATTAGGATTAPRGPAVTQTPGAPAPPPGGGSLPTTGPVTDGAALGGMAALGAGIVALLISRRRTV